MADETMVAVRDVELTYGRGAAAVPVLRGASLTVSRGQSLAVTGPSGSGKSTLLMVLGGLERPDAGEVRIAGENIVAMRQDALTAFRGRAMGIVFQSFHLIATMTALENVAVPLELAHVADAHRKARDELAAVGLADRADHYPTELSGGEQQRVAIARALAPQPAVILADEPTGNLDEETGTEIADLMFAACRERGETLILVTHDMALAARCERMVRVAAGRVEDVTAAEAAE
ncbi:MAG: ABC transporter ATP-binding protein [Acuticoccus sp.]